MATKNRTGQHHPDVQRDFETGTVNPGPGMAPPLRDADTNPGQNNNPAAAGETKSKTGTSANPGTEQGKGSCGCG